MKHFDWNEPSTRLALYCTAAASLLALFTILLHWISSIKKIRCMNTISRSLPVIREASEAYLLKQASDSSVTDDE